MDESETAQAIGHLQARADGVDGRFSKMEKKVDDIHEIVLKSQGGFKMMLFVASGFAGFGALVGSFLSWFKFK